MNTPSSTGDNWKWRMKPGALGEKEINDMIGPCECIWKIICLFKAVLLFKWQASLFTL